MGRVYDVSADLGGRTVAAALRELAAPLSWGEAKSLVLARQVEINGVLCLNDARRVAAGDQIDILDAPRPPLPGPEDVRLVHVDQHLIVVDKPPGVVTLRHRDEKEFSDDRKELEPSLEELVQKLLMHPAGPPPKPRRNRPPKPRRTTKATPLPPLYPVHRLDRDTSGLMLFALTPLARDRLIERFSRHEIDRSYLAVVHGRIEAPMTVATCLVRDRGDGLRGSAISPPPPEAKRAVTHVRPVEHLTHDGAEYTVLECRLETGRTHQIRIHLAEIGHMLCGEKLYRRPAPGVSDTPDLSRAPRQALHSTDLRLLHPITDRQLRFVSPLPKDLSHWLTQLRS